MKIKLLPLLLLLFCQGALAQVVLKEKKTEKDGFSYVLLKTDIYPVYYGLATDKGKVIVPLEKKYMAIFYGGNGFFCFSPDHSHYGLMDTKGKIVIPPEYDLVVPQKNNETVYIQLNKDNKVGVANQKGSVIIPPKYYDTVYLYDAKGEKYFSISLDGKKGIADLSGKEIIPPKYDDVIMSEHNGIYYYRLKDDDLYGIANAAGKVILAPESTTFIHLTGDPGYEYYLFTSVSSLGEGMMDKTGKILIPPVYSSIYKISKSSSRYFEVTYKDKVGVCDFRGNVIIPAEYEYISLIQSKKREFFETKQNGKYGLCNLSGEVVLKNHYDGLLLFDNDRLEVTDSKGHYVEAELLAKAPGSSSRPAYSHPAASEYTLSFKQFCSPKEELIQEMREIDRLGNFPIYLSFDTYLTPPKNFADPEKRMNDDIPLAYDSKELEEWLRNHNLQKEPNSDLYCGRLYYKGNNFIYYNISLIFRDKQDGNASYVDGITVSLNWTDMGVNQNTDVIGTYLDLLQKIYGNPPGKKTEDIKKSLPGILSALPDNKETYFNYWRVINGIIKLSFYKKVVPGENSSISLIIDYMDDVLSDKLMWEALQAKRAKESKTVAFYTASESTVSMMKALLADGHFPVYFLGDIYYFERSDEYARTGLGDGSFSTEKIFTSWLSSLGGKDLSSKLDTGVRGFHIGHIQEDNTLFALNVSFTPKKNENELSVINNITTGLVWEPKAQDDAVNEKQLYEVVNGYITTLKKIYGSPTVGVHQPEWKRKGTQRIAHWLIPNGDIQTVVEIRWENNQAAVTLVTIYNSQREIELQNKEEEEYLKRREEIGKKVEEMLRN